MRATVSRAVMSLAIRCLGERRREWALAMRAEFEVAAGEGKPLAFACGCLIAALREMPGHAEGRDTLANYALALGLLIPMAVLQFGLALGFSSVLVGGEASHGVLLPGVSHNPMLAWSQVSAAPSLLGLWFLLGIGHLRLAWVLVERDWGRVVKVGAFIGATLATLALVMGALALDLTFVALQALAMAIEAKALITAARRQDRLSSDGALGMPTG